MTSTELLKTITVLLYTRNELLDIVMGLVYTTIYKPHSVQTENRMKCWYNKA